MPVETPAFCRLTALVDRSRTCGFHHRRDAEFWVAVCWAILTHKQPWKSVQIPAVSHQPSTSYPPSTAIMCASCNGNDSNGHTNSHTNGAATNGANGNDEFVQVNSSYNPRPTQRSSPYAPVGGTSSSNDHALQQFVSWNSKPVYPRAYEQSRG
jgi:hypothetical protein